MSISIHLTTSQLHFAFATLFAWLLMHGSAFAQVAATPPQPPLTPGERMTVSLSVETATEKRFGSGFLVTEQGYLITSYRLVAGAQHVTAIFRNQIRWEVAGHVGMDAGSDLILLKLVNPRHVTFTPLRIAAQDPQVGDDVEAISGVLGVLHPNVPRLDSPATGKITSRPPSREIDLSLEFGAFAKSGLDQNTTWLRTSAPVTSDHRGGPVLNAIGEVVGMTIWMPEMVDGMNLAVPASELLRLLKEAHPTASSHARALNTMTVRSAKPPVAPAPPALPIAVPLQGQDAALARFQHNLQRFSADGTRRQVVEEDAKLYQQYFDDQKHEHKVVLAQAEAVDAEIKTLEAPIRAAEARAKSQADRERAKNARDAGKKGDDGKVHVDYSEAEALKRSLAKDIDPLKAIHKKLLNEAQVIVFRGADIMLMQSRLDAEKKSLDARIVRRRGSLFLQLCDLPGMPARKDGQEILAALNDRLSRMVDQTNPRVCELELARGLICEQMGEKGKSAIDVELAANEGSPVRTQALAVRGYHRIVNGNAIEGAVDLKQALALDNKDPVVLVLRGLAHASAEDFSNAERYLKLALPLAVSQGGGEAEIQRLLGLLYATCPNDKVRDSTKAIKAAQKSCELTLWRDWSCVDALAAAYAEAGKFDQALLWSQAAADLAGDANRAQCLERRKLYEAGKPLRLTVRQE